MKKLSLILALVFAGCFVMAQNSTWVTQSGTNNVASVIQHAGGLEANNIYALQSGTYNALTTEQTGTKNYIELTQGLGGHNVATMEQFSAASGGLNTAAIAQTGDFNEANLTQKEDPLAFPDDSKNLANTTQSGNNNLFNLKQGGNEWSPVNTQNLLQSGDNNDAAINQFGYTDNSTINQIGDGNDADLKQTAGQGGAGTAVSNSYQEGLNNNLDVLQGYDSALHQANSTQNGSGNITNIKQDRATIENVVASQQGSDILNVTQIGRP